MTKRQGLRLARALFHFSRRVRRGGEMGHGSIAHIRNIPPPRASLKWVESPACTPTREVVMTKYALTLLLAAFMLAPARAATPPPAATQASPDEIKKLIDQLGDSEYPKREEAAKRIKSIGKP